MCTCRSTHFSKVNLDSDWVCLKTLLTTLIWIWLNPSNDVDHKLKEFNNSKLFQFFSVVYPFARSQLPSSHHSAVIIIAPEGCRYYLFSSYSDKADWLHLPILCSGFILPVHVKGQLLMLFLILNDSLNKINLMVIMRVTSCTWIDHFNICRCRERQQGCTTPPLKRFPLYHKWQKRTSDYNNKCPCLVLRGDSNSKQKAVLCTHGTQGPQKTNLI